MHEHTIGTVIGELNRVEARGDVGVRILGTADLVEELRGDGTDRHDAARAGMLGDDEAAVGAHLRDREPRMAEVTHLFEKGVVPAGALRATLDDVAGDDAGGEAVPVVALPPEAPRRRAEGQRGIGDARADHEIGTALERRDDAPRPEVRVRAQDRLRQRAERRAFVEVRELLAARLQLAELRHQVVALDVRHGSLDAELAVERPRRLREPAGIQPARVHDDLDPTRLARGRDLLELPQKRPRIPEALILQPILQKNHQRQLGEIIAGQDVDRTALHHLPRRTEPVPIEPTTIRNPQYVRHGRSLIAASLRPRRQLPPATIKHSSRALAALFPRGRRRWRDAQLQGARKPGAQT